MSTVYHSKYYAHELTRRFSSDRLEKLSQSLFNATVDLNPHQVEAALFAFRSPLSRGAILADEVGLGKTIEAGLIISQLWAERKRRILIVLPAALREQWNRELVEKFFIESIQRSLMTLVLRKILASSSFAIANTLGSLVQRLEAKIAQTEAGALNAMTDVLAEDYETIAETQDEWDESESSDEADNQTDTQNLIQAIRQEVKELREYKILAESITQNAKGDALLIALQKGFEKAAALQSPRKALIFTESRRTQRYLHDLLYANGYAENIVMLNGTNNEPESQHIYRDWIQRHAGQDVISGSKSVDVRVALVEAFRQQSAIMIATESGAEGINRQFCNLVVNYDLPWNPQRIEQRIGRCHRYGQQHDVVVINFLNRKNAADQRVFELLSEKFHLFSGIFGASDEVLGAIESGVDFERRIHEIYQTSRTHEEITSAFDQLQLELEEQIAVRLADTRAKLLENFDADVHARLRLNRDQTREQIGRFEAWLWRLIQYELSGCASFDTDDYTFHLNRLPDDVRREGIALGPYRLITHKNGLQDHHFRLGHPLAEQLIARAKSRPLSASEITFRYDRHPTRISIVEHLQGHSGWLCLSLLTIEALEPEQHLRL